MYLQILVLEFTSYIEMYNMSICLFIIIKIIKVKVVSWLECVPFIDVIHMIQGEIMLRPPQWNISLLWEYLALELEPFMFLT